jgi:hypothetical protein
MDRIVSIPFGHHFEGWPLLTLMPKEILSRAVTIIHTFSKWWSAKSLIDVISY